MNKQGLSEVHSSEAPEPVGPYSQAVKAGGFVFVSGQIGIDPATGELVEGVEMQAVQALDNLAAVIREAGSGTDRVVKVTLFLADMSDFAAVNGIYSRYFSAPFPARAAFEVSGLPLGALVEVEAVALAGKETT